MAKRYPVGELVNVRDHDLVRACSRVPRCSVAGALRGLGSVRGYWAAAGTRGGRGVLLLVLTQPDPARMLNRIESNRFPRPTEDDPGRPRVRPRRPPDLFVPPGLFRARAGWWPGCWPTGRRSASRRLRAADWHLALPMSLSGIGLFLTLALGVWMARRPKLPFVLVPGFASCAACLGMALAPDPLAFLFLLGLFNLLDSVSRPAIAVIIRLNYPAESRGWVTGRLRRWSAGTFLVAARWRRAGCSTGPAPGP